MSIFLRIPALVLAVAGLLIQQAADVQGQQQKQYFTQQLSVSAGANTALPFWLSANQFGVIPASGASVNARLSYGIAHDDSARFSYAAGADFIGRAAVDPTFFFQQLYGELKWGPFLLRAGRKEETRGEVHPSLSLGSMILSNNAAPITGISISWPAYLVVPGTGTFLAVKGHFKHGWIDGYRIATRPMLHAKSLYVRFGKSSWPIKGWAGILHYNMWGGRHRNENIGDLPSSFEDFLRVIFIQGASSNTSVNGEITNVLGNSVGAYDFGLALQRPGYSFMLYRQFYLEDTVATRFRSPWDGIWGFGVKRLQGPFIFEEILYEHVNLKQQGSKAGEPRGTDNYYNHFIYSGGWTHRGRTLGTPAILMRPDQVGVFNNILLAHHLALRGALLPALRYELRLTYSRNYGANSIFRSNAFGFTMEGARFDAARDQFYTSLDLAYQTRATLPVSVFTRLGYDWGDVLTDRNFGFTLGVKRVVR